MAVWFTSDTHWGHKNIIKHTERPFGSVRQMDEALVKNWNRVVKKGDIVYHLGDVGHKCSPAYLKKILDQLNGRIYLIHGNHDRVAMSTQCKGRFESITPLKEAFITDSSSRKGRRVIVLCHYAMRVWNMRHWGSWHLYGHSHGKLEEDPGAMAFDVGVDSWDYTPVSYAQVRSKMNQRTNAYLIHGKKR
jgi:calcineurin-like phosphoesterase family protein